MPLHPSTFNSIEPTSDRMKNVAYVRNAFTDFAAMLDTWVPEGPDKTYLMRKLREVDMWTTVAITRGPDGAPRT